ncbi:hypothetical protein LAZ40_06675 [Cereibacter sphaeroides]|uniref:hypothetical protein n=1 Tax=Cereibacter sphaeroides TaxID=1063 RepID=UPI001F1BD422|nr:hypothetical protein [Cereibacter sphaeroides]MCE6958730.1 hypothetical protein [Cereibacter sphaeroides]MCE6973396.1 hypothetical protein [Cereibacter sphaeroides]
MTRIHHATSRAKAERILSEGMVPGSYWGEEHIAAYYAETVEDDGEEAVILQVDFAALDEGELESDFAGIEEPLCFTLRRKEDEIREDWNRSDRGWRDSLEIIGSLRHRGPIPAQLLSLVEDGPAPR